MRRKRSYQVPENLVVELESVKSFQRHLIHQEVEIAGVDFQVSNADGPGLHLIPAKVRGPPIQTKSLIVPLAGGTTLVSVVG